MSNRVGEIKLISFAEIDIKPMRCPYTSTAEDLALMEVIEKEFAKHHPCYRWTIFWRYRYVWQVPNEYAIKAVRKGYSSPSAAATDRVIPRRLLKHNPHADRALD